MEDNRRSNIVALALIIIGSVSLICQFLNINLWNRLPIWEIIMFFIGVHFEYRYFRDRRAPGILVPGAILMTIGLVDFLKWLTLGYFFIHFPAVIVGVAIGLFQLYWYGNRNGGLLIPVAILTFIALDDILDSVFFGLNRPIFWSLALIVVGVYLIFNTSRKS